MPKITRQQVNELTDKKVQQIKDLADKLKITIKAEQAIVQGNLIRPVVYFLDREEYDVEEPPVVQRGPFTDPRNKFKGIKPNDKNTPI